MKHLLPILIAFLLTSLMATAQIYESYKHVPPTVSNSGFAGSAIDIDGDWAVVGAPGEANNGGVTTGGVHIYHRENDEWVYFGKKQPFDFTEDFGERVAIEGDWMAVAAPDDDFNPPTSGAVYMYRYFSGEWNYQVKLTHPESISASFGRDVEMDGGRLAIGTFDADYELARVYIYTLQGGEWEVDAEISPAIPEDNGFGTRIELEGDDLVIKGNGLLTGGGMVGSFYQFEYDGAQWQEVAQVFGPSEEGVIIAGIDLTMRDEHLVMTLPLYQYTGTNNGNAYYFSKVDGQFQYSQTIAPPVIEEWLDFGTSGDIMGDRLLIGCPGCSENGIDKGAMYQYAFDGELWQLSDSLFPEFGSANESFGTSAKFFGQGCLVGARGNDEGANNGGAIYFFENLFVGLPEASLQLEFSLYPNPAGDAIQIIMQDQHSIDYQLVDMQGRVIQSGKFGPQQPKQILVHNLKSSIYSLIIRAENGIAVQRFVKE